MKARILLFLFADFLSEKEVTMSKSSVAFLVVFVLLTITGLGLEPIASANRDGVSQLALGAIFGAPVVFAFALFRFWRKGQERHAALMAQTLRE